MRIKYTELLYGIYKNVCQTYTKHIISIYRFLIGMNEWERTKNITPADKRAKATPRPATSTSIRNKVQIDTFGAVGTWFSKSISQGLQ